jgi:CHASE1-domain containing sensor protein
VSRDRRVDRWRRPIFSPRTVPWAVLAGALAFTIATSLSVRRSGLERDDARFQNAVLGTEDLIERRVQLYMITLQGVAGLFSAMDTVTAEDFRAYVARLETPTHFPGIQGIGWSERLAADPAGAGEGHERYATRYLEPMDARNRAAIGYDMYSEATRREAMARARDQAVPSLSGKVRLVQEIFGEEQAGFLMYVPVYRGREVPERLDHAGEVVREIQGGQILSQLTQCDRVHDSQSGPLHGFPNDGTARLEKLNQLERRSLPDIVNVLLIRNTDE